MELDVSERESWAALDFDSLDLTRQEMFHDFKKRSYLDAVRIRMRPTDPLVRYKDDSCVKWKIYPTHKFSSSHQLLTRLDTMMSSFLSSVHLLELTQRYEIHRKF